MAVTTIWLARHGEVHNPSNVLYGRMPRVRLTPEGRRQAQALADFLGPRPLAAIYSSPMLRARRTAAAILDRCPDLERVRIDSDLQEVRTGWEGESLRAIQQRMLRWLKRVLDRHPGGEVVGVSHGDPILILVGTLRGLPLDPRQIFPRPYIAPGVVYQLRLDG